MISSTIISGVINGEDPKKNINTPKFHIPDGSTLDQQMDTKCELRATIQGFVSMVHNFRDMFCSYINYIP